MEMMEKKKRLAILAKIDEWDKLRCYRCGNYDHGNQHDATKCNCKAAVEVRKLGVEYEEGSRLKRLGRVDKLLRSFRRNELSVEVYDKLKAMEVDDRTIMKHLKIRNDIFVQWKYSVGRMKHPPRQPEIKEQEDAEYTKWRIIASANGVSAKKFHQRVHQYGVPYQEAVNPEPMKRVHNRSLWMDIAKNNGISYKTFKSRKYRGWTDEEAATTAVEKKVGAR